MTSPARGSPALLDANVLVALASPDHVHHDRARTWFGRGSDFATCPLTQLALVRLLMRFDVALDVAVQALDVFTGHDRHSFWSADVPVDGVALRGIIGHRQVTDAYLVALAAHNDGWVATFDAGLASTYPERAALI